MNFDLNAATIPQILIGSGAAVGAIYFLIKGFFGEARRSYNEEQSLEERIKLLLRENIEAQEKQVEAQDLQIQKLTAQIELLRGQVEKLRTENEIITKILQGRDDDSVEFRKRGLESMELVTEMRELLAEHHDEARRFWERTASDMKGDAASK